MDKGKKKCKALRELRVKIAKANDIDYQPAECHHEGDCAGTCPLCEQELAELTKQLRERQDKGENVELEGIADDPEFGNAVIESNIEIYNFDDDEVLMGEERHDRFSFVITSDDNDDVDGQMPVDFTVIDVPEK